MMNRCSSSSSHGNMMGPCSCGSFHTQNNNSSFSMLFSNHHHKCFDTETDINNSNNNMYNYNYNYCSSPSSVDCTLSLGTPSTRQNDDVYHHQNQNQISSGGGRRGGGGGAATTTASSCMSNFCWDLLQTNKNVTHNSFTAGSHKPGRGNSNINSGNDSLLARRCANCDTTSTPLWRNGPRGPKSLCNACGIRFKKEERRATAANANGGSGGVNATASGMMDQQYHTNNNTTWVHHQTQRIPCFSPANEFRFMEETERESDTSNSIPFLSWRLNITDRPSLVHDFTR